MAVSNPGNEQAVPLNSGSGPTQARTLEITTLLPNGALATVEMEVIAIADKMGNIVSNSRLEGLLEDVIDLLKEIKEAIEDQ